MARYAKNPSTAREYEKSCKAREKIHKELQENVLTIPEGIAALCMQGYSYIIARELVAKWKEGQIIWKLQKDV